MTVLTYYSIGGDIHTVLGVFDDLTKSNTFALKAVEKYGITPRTGYLESQQIPLNPTTLDHLKYKLED
jgi:hypothetical protein